MSILWHGYDKINLTFRSRSLKHIIEFAMFTELSLLTLSEIQKKGHSRCPKRGTRFPKWGTLFPEWGARCPELGTLFFKGGPVSVSDFYFDNKEWEPNFLKR